MRHVTAVLVSSTLREGKKPFDRHETAVEAFEENANVHDMLSNCFVTLPSVEIVYTYTTFLYPIVVWVLGENIVRKHWVQIRIRQEEWK